MKNKVPVIAIVGRPNVGKSTFFNYLTRTRDALVMDAPGVTRDRIYGMGKIGKRPYIVIDTGGIGEKASVIEDIDTQTSEQAWRAIEESDLILFLVDARAGLTNVDMALAHKFRQLQIKVCLVVNKIDGVDWHSQSGEFYQLGLPIGPFGISSAHGMGVHDLIQTLFTDYLPEEIIDPLAEDADENTPKRVKIAVIGRPNVGKSTLVNRLLGEERVMVYDAPHTTRDSVYIDFDHFDNKYTLIDTAGVRRGGRVELGIEKFSVIKTLQAVEDANVVIFVMDAQEGITDHDLNLLGFCIEAGRALVIAINKWDNLPLDQKETVKEQIKRKLPFAKFAKIFTISALHGTNTGHLFEAVDKAYESAMKVIPTAKLNIILEKLISAHAPPRANGRQIKLRYAHCGGHNPPIIVIHGNQTEHLPVSYKRYLMNAFLEALKLEGTPVRIETRTVVNPYVGEEMKKDSRTNLEKWKEKRQRRNKHKHKK
jgi:GTP-binding protein